MGRGRPRDGKETASPGWAREWTQIELIEVPPVKPALAQRPDVPASHFALPPAPAPDLGRRPTPRPWEEGREGGQGSVEHLQRYPGPGVRDVVELRQGAQDVAV